MSVREPVGVLQDNETNRIERRFGCRFQPQQAGMGDTSGPAFDAEVIAEPVGSPA